MTTIHDVRRIALALPETTEKPMYGTPAFRVKDKAFARLREEGDVLVVWCADEDEKDAHIATEPETFFTLPHYDGYALVLVRLPAMREDALRHLLTEAWRLRAPRRLVAAFDADLEAIKADT